MAYTTINKSTEHFNTKIYTGTGSSLALTGVGFQPDFTWIKCRAAGSGTDHVLFDAVRGVTKALNSNDNSIEDTISNSLTAFGTDGFTVNGNGATGASGDTYVGWNWKANGAGSANTDGSINSTVSVNQTAGFSIVSWTGNAVAGATIGHGLGVKPSMIILKNRTPDTASWTIYHSSLGATKYMVMESTNAVQTSNTRWYDTEPTNQVFTVGSSGNVTGDNSGETFVAYCFAEKTGYSKFGTYTGNGSSDGTFVFCGFKPAMIILKNTETAKDWNIWDNKRGFNGVNKLLYPSLTNAEGSGEYIDLLSNGFKLRDTNNKWNSAEKFIYMAFAENPFVNSGGVPTTAR